MMMMFEQLSLLAVHCGFFVLIYFFNIILYQIYPFYAYFPKQRIGMYSQVLLSSLLFGTLFINESLFALLIFFPGFLSLSSFV